MQIDARGLACPEPVVRVQRGVKESPEGLRVLVDNRVAVENITRFAAARKYAVEVTDAGEGSFLLVLTRRRTGIPYTVQYAGCGPYLPDCGAGLDREAADASRLYPAALRARAVRPVGALVNRDLFWYS